MCSITILQVYSIVTVFVYYGVIITTEINNMLCGYVCNAALRLLILFSPQIKD